MIKQPRVNVFASYIEKEHEFFSWGRSLGEYEIGAINLTEEERDYITLVDLLCPQKDKIMRAHPGCLENGNLRETERIVSPGIEMISTRKNCWFSESFYSRINTSPDGRAHNHFNCLFPSAHDMIALISFIHRTNLTHNYAIDIIHYGNGFEIFCFSKQDLFVLRKQEPSVEFIRNWLHDNYSRIHVENYKVIADK